MKIHLSRLKKRKISIKESIVLLILVIVTLIFIIESVHTYCALKDIRDDVLEVYYGQYELYERELWRNTIHVFRLENGDTLTVPTTNGTTFFNGDNSKFEEIPELKISYSKQRFLFWRGTYVCVSIETTDGTTLILDGEIVQDELEGRALLFLCIGLCLLPFLLGYFLIIRFY